MSILNLLPSDKIKIRLNKKPIRMDLFLSFLTVDVERSISHLGVENGWTMLTGDNGLIVEGGKVRINGELVELLDSVRFGKKIANPYNNYVTPLHLKAIMSKEGFDFFVKYYEAEINGVIEKRRQEVLKLKSKMEDKEAELSKICDEANEMRGFKS